MIRCPQGHYFDTARHSSCPWCANAVPLENRPSPAPAPAASPPGVTLPMPGPESPPPAVSAGSMVTETVRPGIGPEFKDAVVGWLVCVEGGNAGRDFRIRPERNFIGRSPSMDIALENDESVSRDRHAILTFDPRKKEFWIQPGDSSGMVYLNGGAVHVPQRLRERDTIEVGRTKLVFVPFVNEKFQWK